MNDGLTVAVLGTGTMGAPMARNIAAAGMAVRVWNRSQEKAQAIEESTAFPTAREAAAGADLVVTMLADGKAVEDTVTGDDGALAGMEDDAVWLQMSTVGIAATERLAKLAGERGVAFVDAPVVGTKQPAEQGELTVLASGPEDSRERARPVFDAVAAKVVDLGDAGEGTRLKLVINNWLVTLVEGVAETLAFAEAIGIDPQIFLETIDGGPTGPAYAQVKGKAMIAREFPPAFSLKLARKDAELVLEAAERVGFDAALARTVDRKMGEAIEFGHGDEDMAATFYASAPDRAVE